MAEAFYRDVMGLKLAEASPYALAFADGDSTLRVQIVDDFKPADFTAHGWQVSDIDAEVRDLSAKGVVFQTFVHLDQNEHGVWTSPSGARIAWFSDPSGNILSLTQYP